MDAVSNKTLEEKNVQMCNIFQLLVCLLFTVLRLDFSENYNQGRDSFHSVIKRSLLNVKCVVSDPGYFNNIFILQLLKNLMILNDKNIYDICYKIDTY